MVLKNHDDMTSNKAFPVFPKEDELYAHASALYLEQASSRFAEAMLLAPAEGQMTAESRLIKDVDLTTLPELPEDDRDHNRRHEARIKHQTQNAQNAEKRLLLELQAWTKIYTMLKISTETTAPVLSRQLMTDCDMQLSHGIAGGYFDGPRAWRTVKGKLSGGGKRTDADKKFYRAAERVQLTSHLADGCSGSDYGSKALAFLVHIRPYLAQGYDDEDTTAYLVDLMPKQLKEGGRRIKMELMMEKKYTDHMYVINKCTELVIEEQKRAAPAPAFVVAHTVTHWRSTWKRWA